MNRIDEAFARCASEKRAAFVAFIMAGDPDLTTTLVLIEALLEGGADVIELGVPFSDPIADGPVNQRSAVRALTSGTRLAGVLDLVARARRRWQVPIVLFSYFNPILAQGVLEFAARAAASGVDGVLCLDLPPEEAVTEFVDALAAEQLAPIFLLAPTSTKSRIRRVDELAQGFVYYVSRTGVTGDRAELAPELIQETKALRRRLHHPLAVGFGISTPDQVAAVGAVADGVVVGSALVRLIEEHGGAAAGPLATAVRELSEPLRQKKKGWFRR
ncbi:MAG: tryptophan synthase subunit alpha [Acidobacteria bacterium]|nr:tryptophan synthase subunit alpha [Acidobacteriota bacterium]